MDSHLVVYRSKSGNIDRIKDFISWAKTGRVEGWSATKTFKPGDLVFFYFGSPAKSIIALGKVESEPYTEQGPFDWTQKTKTTSCDFNPVWLLDNPIPLSQFINDPVIAKWYEGQPYRHTQKIPQKVASALLRKVVVENPKIKNNLMKSGIGIPIKKWGKGGKFQRKFEEGSIREIVAELRKRDPELKRALILKRGYECEVCGFEFIKRYGELGAGYIEIQHLRPLSQLRKESEVSMKDAAVVCSNCHRMLHRNGAQPIKIDKLRKFILNP